MSPVTAREKKLASETSYHSCKCFSEHFIANKMKKTKILMNKPVYVGQAVLPCSKTLMYEFWYDYLNPKYGDQVKLCYMNIDNFIFKVERDGFYKDTLPDFNKRYDTFKIDKKLNRCIPIGVNPKVIGMLKDELNGRVMSEFFALDSKLYAFQDIDNDEEKKAKGAKKCVIKKVLNFSHYTDALLLNKTIRSTQQRFENHYHVITTEEINKIA